MLIVAVLVVGFSFCPRTIENSVGVCVHIEDFEDFENQTISHLIDLGVSYVRTDWSIPNDSMRKYSEDLQNNNIKLLAIIDHKTFGYKIPSLEEWNRTITELVTSEDFRYVDAVEIWNEPNAGLFALQPEDYYEMLKSAYAIIKNYTKIPVIFAGVSPEVSGWEVYLNTVFALRDTQDNFDFMGIHLYGNLTYNLHTLQFVKGLTSKPIWLTETGKPSAFEGNTEQGQAEYLSYVYITARPLASKIFFYELRDGTWEPNNPKEVYFGLLTREGAKKEAYHIVWNICRDQ